MRPSTFVTLTVALLVGLGVAVAVKMSGILNPPPKPAPPKTISPQVLVPRVNLYKDYIIKPGDLVVRHLELDEAKAYAENHRNFLPPNPAVGHYRVVKEDIQAGQALKNENLEPIGLPDPLNKRLLPLTRPLSVKVDKQRSVGGLIQSGDWVDVFLTCEISTTADGPAVRKTALVARNVPVIAKRDTLFNVTLPLNGETVQFTIAPNLYRAALVDYVRDYGTISLFPVSRSEKQRLDDERLVLEEFDEGLDSDELVLERVVALAFNNDSFEAHADELDRLDSFSKGDGGVIGQEDLVRLFELPVLEPAKASPSHTVEMLSGIKRSGSLTFVPIRPGKFVQVGEQEQGPAPEYIFRKPGRAGEKNDRDRR